MSPTLMRPGRPGLHRRVKLKGGVEEPMHYDFRSLRNSPAEMRALFNKLGWRKIVCVPDAQSDAPRAHQELTFRAAKLAQANLLIHPVVGMTKPGDIDHYSRVRCYEHPDQTVSGQSTMLSLLHLAMRMGGPRGAVWHAIRKNHGCAFHRRSRPCRSGQGF